MLFVPGDPFLDAAITTDSGLLEYAFGRERHSRNPDYIDRAATNDGVQLAAGGASRDMATVQQWVRSCTPGWVKSREHLDSLGVNSVRP